MILDSFLMLDPKVAKIPNDMLDKLDGVVEKLGVDVSPVSFDELDFAYALGQTMARVESCVNIPVERVVEALHSRINRIVQCFVFYFL